jgi:hypothetical protein
LGGEAAVKLLVGCPIFERAWIFDRWADSVLAQTWPAGTEVEYAFAYTPGEDDTLEAILRRFRGEVLITHCGDLVAFRNDQRGDDNRYYTLAEARNRLFDAATSRGMDYFLSWDSDMIFPDVLGKLFIDKPVVGALTDMTGVDWLMDEGHGFPSFMQWSERGPRRPEGWKPEPGMEPFEVAVPMGTVLWRRDAFSRVRYCFDRLGEDIGVARMCEAYGIERWLVPEARGEHVMHQEQGGG